MAQFSATDKTPLPPELHIVVTCSERKRAAVPPRLQLRSFPQTRLGDRSVAWLRAVRSVEAPVLTAASLYAGEHWTIARSLPDVATAVGSTATLWVASAGYGLVRADTLLKPYAATFAPGHPDSVWRESDGPVTRAMPRWWARLGEWEGPAHQESRTLAELARARPESTLVVACSPSYLAALTPDLESAASELLRPSQLLIISSAVRRNGETKSGALARFLLPADARLQHMVGGARQSLNVRLARWLLEQSLVHRFRRDQVDAMFHQALRRQPPLPRYDRRSASDDELIAWIRNARGRHEAVSKTVLLRRIRDEGVACEQKRFGLLFAQALQMETA